MKKDKISILITGGAGYIGSSLTYILKKYFEVFVIDDLSIGKRSQVKTKNFFNINLLNKKIKYIF